MKVLFFTVGAVASKGELEVVAEMRAGFNGRVILRNGSACGEGDSKEACDAVAGKIPDLYAKVKRFSKKTKEVKEALDDALGGDGDGNETTQGDNAGADLQLPTTAPKWAPKA